MPDITVTVSDRAGRMSSATYTFDPSSIACPPSLFDGDIDHTDAFNAWLAALPDGVTVNLPALSARLDKTVVHPGRGITIDGHGAFTHYTDLTGIDVGVLTAQGASNRHHWRLSNTVGATLRGITIRGPNNRRAVDKPNFALYLEAYAFEHGVLIGAGARDAVVQDLTITQVWGDNVTVNGGNSTNRPVNITIQRITGTYNGRQGLGVVSVDGLLVEDYDAQWGGSSGCDIEPNGAQDFVNDVTLRRCTFGCHDYPYNIGGANSPAKRQRIRLEDCVGRNTTSAHGAIQAGRGGTDIAVVRHTDHRPITGGGFCMVIGGWNGVTVEDCSIGCGKQTPTSYGIHLSNDTGALSIVDSTFSGTLTGGVSTEGADQLFLADGNTDPTAIVHHGNMWNFGHSTD